MISILLYHQIAQVPKQYDPLGLAVPPRLFEQQMAYLYRAGYRCLGLGEAVKYLRERKRQPRKSFVLTFDDGYQDLYYNVWPILDRFGFTATIFLVVGRAGCESDWEGQRGPSAAPLLSWTEARELAHIGFAFGSHTLTHPRLTLLDDKQAVREIQHSKAIMEDHLGVKVELFSYPYANFDARIQDMVAESGYIAACGTDRGAWGPFNLWRAHCASNGSRLSFALKADGWHHKLVWLREQSLLGRPLVRVFRCLRSTARNSQGNTGSQHQH